MTYSPLVLLCLLAAYTMRAQFSFDFNDDSFDLDGSFGGQTDHFTVEDGWLKLAAFEAGTSIIHTRTNIPDSLELGVHFSMDFSPSVNNLLRIYLQIDTFDLSKASGYYIEIGENGSDDRIRFNRILNGESLTIAEGHPGEFGEGPIDCYLKVVRDQSGFWQIGLKHADEDLYRVDLELFDSTIKRYFDQYVAIECIYTTTRKDKFYFDDLYLKQPVPDTKPPE